MPFFKKKKKNQNYPRQSPISVDDYMSGAKYGPLHLNLDQNLQFIQSSFGGSIDLITRRIKITSPKEMEIGLVYIEGIADSAAIQEFVIQSLLEDKEQTSVPPLKSDDSPIKKMAETIMTIGDVSFVKDFDELFNFILSGETALLLENSNEAIIAKTRGIVGRSVGEPLTQNVVRGPQEGFVEQIRMNTSLIRRRIRNPHLRLESKQIGRITKTDVSIMYIEGIANPKVVNEVRERLGSIDIDAILESAYIEELIQDSTFSPFPTIFNTERPDVASAGILEGRVAILVDGTPFVLLAPVLFTQFMQSAEDYYQRSDLGLIRMLRYITFVLALLSPSIFIAVTTFHQELIPTSLAITLTVQREGVPFPAFFEALLMEFTFEILREAGLRMPKAVGTAISIVGALVIGQAAVEAGLATAAMVIVVAITAISSFVLPAYNLAISVRGLRFGFMILAATFGLFGIAVGLFILVLHLCSLRSFGIPYLAPIAPYNNTDQQDAIFHFPLKWRTTRPRLISQLNKTKQQPKASKQTN
ncbi:spore germination protein KA [Bacillus ectoiniformans]|uniref:spore germination protein n=1 Tax=Bacillus ectoiniformans TaxID=1494429 RepID=UPI00195D0E88|nr:spore germination protein [Bacillus ectoiniformans]MBM7649606.1 spore germination protein KA [Bacillus ectoiniformans]